MDLGFHFCCVYKFRTTEPRGTGTGLQRQSAQPALIGCTAETWNLGLLQKNFLKTVAELPGPCFVVCCSSPPSGVQQFLEPLMYSPKNRRLGTRFLANLFAMPGSCWRCFWKATPHMEHASLCLVGLVLGLPGSNPLLLTEQQGAAMGQEAAWTISSLWTVDCTCGKRRQHTSKAPTCASFLAWAAAASS